MPEICSDFDFPAFGFKNEKEVLQVVMEPKNRIEFVRIIFPDILGRQMDFSIPREELPQAFEEGKGFDGSSIEGFVRIEESDLIIRPDPTSCRVLPWEYVGFSLEIRWREAIMFGDILTPEGKLDFRAYTIVNIYEHKNAYYVDSRWKKTPRPGRRNYLGEISCTLEEMNHRELVLGTKSRSGEQWDIWEAVFSPVGPDGYPKRIWDKMTGEIDHEVAAYWREHYDLRYILQRDWKILGPKLKGKIHIYCGDMDNYYLNNAVYLMEEFLEGTTDPYYEGEIDYGDRAEHCWNGDHSLPIYLSRLRYHQFFIPKIMDRIKKSAPPGADLHSWRY